MLGRPGFFIAGGEVVAGAVALALGYPSAAASCALAGAFVLVVACVLQVRGNHIERKTNGRYRKAREAHRAGAGRGAGDGALHHRGARGRAGAGMSGGGFPGGMNPNFYQRQHEELVRKMLGLSAAPTTVAHGAKPKARPAGEFDGRAAEFAAGTVRGTRSFDVDKLGRLVGVAFRTVWTPGENVARCMQRPDPFSFLTDREPRGLRESPRPPHSITDCGHGFYGYYEGSNDYYESGRVMAVVEAYGETIIGTRGFRASKARIVALYLPDDLSRSARSLVTRNYAGIPLFESFDAMVAEFPPDDAGQGISPDTDPDFWTREA